MSIEPVMRHEAQISIRAEPEWVPVAGNAMASGDETLDRAVEQEILQRLDQGDLWAWAAVMVEVSWQCFRGSACLGCCSYESEEDFRAPGGYFDDLVEEALADLNRELVSVYQHLKGREVAVLNLPKSAD